VKKWWVVLEGGEKEMKITKDDVIWELERWICPVWQEVANLRWIVSYFLGGLLIIIFTFNPYLAIAWGLGYPASGLILAATIGMFDID
jgi:hypothetical protein